MPYRDHKKRPIARSFFVSLPVSRGSYAKQAVFAYEYAILSSSYAKQAVFAYESRQRTVIPSERERISFFVVEGILLIISKMLLFSLLEFGQRESI